MKKLILYLLLLNLFSCSYFKPQVETEKTAQQSETEMQIYCPNKKNIQLVGTNLSAQKYFLENLALAQKRININQEETALLWLLNQATLRPDLTSPNARITALIKHQNITHLIDSPLLENSFFYGVEFIHQKLKIKRSLGQIINIFDQYFSTRMPVNLAFYRFLEANKSKIKQDVKLNANYIRADEVLNPGESLPKFELTSFYKVYLKNKIKPLTDVEKQTFNYQQNDNSPVITCNYDMKLYESSIFLIKPNLTQTHLFGISLDTISMLATTTQTIEEIKPLNESNFFKAQPSKALPAVCYREDNHQWLISGDSRDPGQHMYHLIRYNIFNATDIEEKARIMNFSRHLFLQKPLRLIFESKRGSSEQLDQLLKMNVPIYNAENLGNVWGQFVQQKQNYLLFDPRSDGALTCK